MYQNYLYNKNYGMGKYNYRSSELQETNSEIIALNQVINFVRKSVGNEKEDELRHASKYNFLIHIAK